VEGLGGVKRVDEVGVSLREGVRASSLEERGVLVGLGQFFLEGRGEDGDFDGSGGDIGGGRLLGGRVSCLLFEME
jgi:hypothetical protein